MIRSVALALVLALPIAGRAASASPPARLDGVTMPRTWTVDGTALRLNGIGARTYSFLGIRIYVAGLYLKHRDDDASAILASRAPKVLLIHFVHGVSAARVRRAWRRGLTRNCTPPCSLPKPLLTRFLDAVRPVRRGEIFTFVFGRRGADVYEGAGLLGRIADPAFSRLMLAVFIGRHTAQPRLKRELLGRG